MKYRIIFSCLAVMMLTVNVQAQRRVRKAVQAQQEVQVPDTAQIVRDYIDSLNLLRSQLDSLQQLNEQLRTESTDGRYLRLFAPATFYHSGANRSFALSPKSGDEVTDAVDDVLMGLYMRRPDLVVNNETNLQAAGTLRDDVNRELSSQIDLTDVAAPLPDAPEAAPVALVVQKPNFWKFKGDGYLQFLQNYVTDNWHKGGESNYSAQGAATLELNYNDKDRITWDNKLEMKLGVQTSREDTVHTFKTNNDLLRLTSKLGLQAHKRWYYTLQLLAYTQFARGYKANNEKVFSDFTSPLDINLGIGMEYKVEAFNKRLTGTLNFLPLALSFRYVARDELIEANGMRGNHHTMEDFASQFTGELKWELLPDYLTWKTRLFAITTYQQAKIEWENQFELKVTKYISANLFIYPRFDDSNKRDDKLGYFQMQEWSSIGLSYTW